jgi:hypothetical protein
VSRTKMHKSPNCVVALIWYLLAVHAKPNCFDKWKGAKRTRCRIEACPLAAQHDLSVALLGDSLHGSPFGCPAASDVLEPFLEAYGVHLGMWEMSHIRKFWMARKTERIAGKGERTALSPSVLDTRKNDDNESVPHFVLQLMFGSMHMLACASELAMFAFKSMSLPRYVSSARKHLFSLSRGSGSCLQLDGSKSIPRPNLARLRSKFQPDPASFHLRRKPSLGPAAHGLTSSAFYIFPRCLTHGDSSVWYAEFLRSSQG